MNILKNAKIKGFTLLELLVVISIIGILIAIGSAAFITAQKKGRDAKRRADMKAYQTVLEQYYAENDKYDVCGTMEGYFSGGSAPVDPKTGLGYNCSTTPSTNLNYCVCAILDFDSEGNSAAGSNGACAFGSDTTDFCVRNLQ